MSTRSLSPLCRGGLFVICLVALAASPALADAVDARVLENTASRVVIQYTLTGVDLSPTRIEGATYTQATLSGEPVLLQAGAPELPHVARSIIIPDTGTMQVFVDDELSQYYELTDVNIVPSKGNLLRTVDPQRVPYEFGPEYSTDRFFPGRLASLGTPYILRDFRGQTVDVFPVQYNPVQGVLRVYTSLTVVVETAAPGGENLLQARDRALSLAFHQLYSEHFLNYDPGLRYTPLDEEGDLLIICHDPWVDLVVPLADHKNSFGLNTTLVPVGDIGNNHTAIKNYIQSVYDTSDLAFVLLVGDGAQVDTPYASGGASDPSYAKLAGGDDYPDILVGRFSAESAGQVETQVLRTIRYEEEQWTQTEWFMRGMGIASNQGPGDDGEYDDEHMDVIREKLLAAGYTVVDQIYDPSGTKQMVTNGLNAGRGIVNYCGHGSTTSWSTTGFNNSDVNALENDNMLPFIVSVACVNGQFDGYTCFAEAWLRATHGTEPTGAIGAYMSSVNQSWNPPMCGQDEVVDRFLDQTYLHLGTLCFAGSCQMMDEYGAAGVEMYDTWHLFGDPSLRVVGTTAPPTGMKVRPGMGLYAEGQAGGPFTPDSITYQLENYNETALDFELDGDAAWLAIDTPTGTIPPLSIIEVTVSLTSAAQFLGNGEYTGTVTFTNTTDHDGDCARTCTLKIGVPTQQYLFSLDAGPGWSCEGEWAFGMPRGNGGASHGFPDPFGGRTGFGAYGVNLLGDYSTTSGGPYYCTTTAINCSELTDVSLKFWRWLNSDYPPYVTNTIQASHDGETWTTIWQGEGEFEESSWSHQVYDLAAVADHEPTVYVRWGYQVGSGAWAYSGWNIDDIEIWGLAPSAPLYQPGDLDCSGAVNFQDINPFVLALSSPDGYATQYPDCNSMLADLNADGVVDFRDINWFVQALAGG